MNDDLNASEKRLIAALDRIDSFIDRMAKVTATSPTHHRGETGDGMQLPQDDLSAIVEEQAEQLAELEARLAATDDRLNSASEEIARLATANEALANANRALIASQPASPSDEIRHALEAELESLRAARDAERGQMTEIVDTLDRMLGAEAQQTEVSIPEAERAGSAPAMVETPMPIDNSRDLRSNLDLSGDSALDELGARDTADGNRG